MLVRTVSIDAPVRTVAAAARHTRTVLTGFAAFRPAPVPPVGELLVPGDGLELCSGGARDSARGSFAVRRADERGVLLARPHDARCRSAEFEVALTGSAAGTSMTVTARPAGDPGGAELARLEEVLDGYPVAVREITAEWCGRPVVVAAAIVDEGRLLAQQRRRPARHAGGWELPGGRVEAGETEAAAVVRECREELAVDVRVLRGFGTDVPVAADGGMLLRAYLASLRDRSAAPRPVEHRAVRWVGVARLPELEWLETDRLLVDSMRSALEGAAR
ncbi:(deoxy)nucleoside triphosphate pyrophosphohydrolase [Actinopolyspora halophila]|uniref:(deoxy)nucleoside triphosphate pyrophosphohydrolase n=1 Tax=Actinopolyspora halophila TaxID=1850 RepID=UPI000368ACCA|nr:NUDIX domain-containing protein [Actinopolyspora halophila]